MKNHEFIELLEGLNPDNCWIWQGKPSKKGYGRVRIDGSQEYTHRLSYMIFKGEIPSDMDVHHTCETKICINPNHLELQPRDDHSFPGLDPHDLTKPKGRKKDTTFCPKGHRKDGKVKCKECNRLYYIEKSILKAEDRDKRLFGI